MSRFVCPNELSTVFHSACSLFAESFIQREGDQLRRNSSITACFSLLIIIDAVSHFSSIDAVKSAVSAVAEAIRNFCIAIVSSRLDQTIHERQKVIGTLPVSTIVYDQRRNSIFFPKRQKHKICACSSKGSLTFEQERCSRTGMMQTQLLRV